MYTLSITRKHYPNRLELITLSNTRNAFRKLPLLPIFPIFDNGYDISDIPQPLRYARRHGRGALDRAMNADEVVSHHMQRNRMRVVLNFFAESVRQPSEPAYVHPDGEIAAL
jgi:hypothetical protein